MLKRVIIKSESGIGEKIYVIPTKKEYMKRRLDRGKSWEETYGRHRCQVCKEPFKEGDEYIAWHVEKYKRMVLVARHATCDPANPPKRKRGKKIEESIEDDTGGSVKIYTDNKTPCGECVIFGGKMFLVEDRDEDEEGEYMWVTPVEEEDDDE